MICRDERMMISIGHKSFLESGCIGEILAAHGHRAAMAKRLAAEAGMLISASEGKRVRSVIKLKTKHIVLSSLEPETIRSKLNRYNTSQTYPAHCGARHSNQTSVRGKHSQAGVADGRTREMCHDPFPLACDDEPERRSGIERRRFSYKLHIPERRSGADRRKCQ